MVHKLNQSLPFYPVGSQQLDDTGNTFRKKEAHFRHSMLGSSVCNYFTVEAKVNLAWKRSKMAQLVPSCNSNLFAKDQIDPFEKLKSITVKLPL